MNLLLVLGSIILLQQCFLTESAPHTENLKSLRFLGSVELENGALIKQYWADDETRSWSEGKRYCESIGPEFSFATIKSRAEVEVLLNAYSSTSFSGTHWMSAVLSENWVMSWADGSSDTVDVNVPWQNSVVASICGGFYSDGANSYFQAVDCSSVEKVICVRTEGRKQTDNFSVPKKNQRVAIDDTLLPSNKDVVYSVGGVPKSFSYLGTIDVENGTLSKQYWADDEARSWNDSKSYCEGVGPGFSLATMKSEEEVELLRKAHNTVTFARTHWMSAVLDPRKSMVWEDDENDAIDDIDVPWRSSTAISICGAYFSNGSQSYFRIIDCSLSFKAICVMSERRTPTTTTTKEPDTTTN